MIQNVNSENRLSQHIRSNNGTKDCSCVDIDIDKDNFVQTEEEGHYNRCIPSDKIFLPIEDLKANFNSRDLIRIFITLTKMRENEEGLSLKGINYWRSLSKNSKFKLLFSKYKPWSLHTSYKRIFSQVTVEEVIKILKSNPKANLTDIMKIARMRKEKKKPNKNKLKGRRNDRKEEYATKTIRHKRKRFSRKFRLDKKICTHSNYSLISLKSANGAVSEFDANNIDSMNSNDLALYIINLLASKININDSIAPDNKLSDNSILNNSFLSKKS
jgi:hypothetical protein